MKALAATLVLIGVLAFPASASAQPSTAGDERATEFRAVQGPVREDIPGGPLLVAAYGVAWTLVLLYVLRLGFLHRRLREDLERVEQAMRQKQKEP